MMECKKALVEAGADMDGAVELLRKSGQAKADKKAGRVAADGRIVVAGADSTAVIVEVNSETDFVSKDDNFGRFAEAVAASILAHNPAAPDAVGALPLEDGRTVEEARAELIAKVGENIGIRRFTRVASDEHVASYVHGSRIGAVVAYRGGDAGFGRDVAMHVSATNPLCISAADVPEETLAAERRILTEQAESSGKPADIVARMVEGRLSKYLGEITLLGQPFVKDPDISVGELAERSGATIVQIVRYEVGEGIEKKADNFAAEVMQQIKGSD